MFNVTTFVNIEVCFFFLIRKKKTTKFKSIYYEPHKYNIKFRDLNL